jgi:hypothetical protein
MNRPPMDSIAPPQRSPLARGLNRPTGLPQPGATRTTQSAIRRLAGWIALLGLGWVSPGLLNAADSDRGYESFRLVQTRNVFDPDRRAPRPQGAVRETTTPARVESVALTGTLVQPDRAVAFFGGSRPEYRQVLPLLAEVAGYTLVAITTSHVELERDGERIQLPVGQGLRREGDGPWELTREVSRPSATASRSATTQSDREPASDNAISDLMKRMMQRRQQEVSR